MSNITDDILIDQNPQDGVSGSFLINSIIVLSVILSAMFVGEMLFGKNSLEAYLSLQKDKEALQQKIYLMQQENAKLQKQYFEYKILMPEEDDL